MNSKWQSYDASITDVLRRYPESGDRFIAREVIKGIEARELDLFRTYIKRNRKRLLDQYEGVYTASDSLDVNHQNIKHLWVKNKGVSAFVKNPDFVNEQEKAIKEIDFLSIFKDKVQPIEINNKVEETALFDRLVYTDVHIGMNPNENGFSQYGGVWSEVEIKEALEKTISHVINNKKSNTLYIDELGDFMDGWDGLTTRGGHKLPQNMDNQKAFDTGLRFKITLVDELIKHYDKIVCHNICNDNHAGAFGYVVNSAFKTFIELKYPNNVEVVNQRKFIDHYEVGNHIFILTHGKDDKSLKFGFKATLDKMQENKIRNYIDNQYLFRKGVKIEFSKGDSHQHIFDNTTSEIFNYYSYPAFSPSSEWVQTNFQKGKSGLVFFNYFDDRKITNELFF
jgi:hypothetical protein